MASHPFEVVGGFRLGFSKVCLHKASSGFPTRKKDGMKPDSGAKHGDLQSL